MLKRAFDLILSAILIVFLVPAFVIISALIKLDSPGPIFFRGERVGRYGRIFRIFKFRTMFVDATKLGGSCTADSDPRITKIGKSLRRYKIDELPQLVNVLIGDMSLVGPRPDVEYYVSKLVAENAKILELRPGITDWASIWNSDEGVTLDRFEDPVSAYESIILPTKIQLQMKYYEENSFWLDLKILAYTLCKLLNKKWIPTEIAPYGDLYRGNLNSRQE